MRKHLVENVELIKSQCGGNLYYEVDGKSFSVFGQFFIDKLGNLHHTHITSSDEEIEIIISYNYNN